MNCINSVSSMACVNWLVVTNVWKDVGYSVNSTWGDESLPCDLQHIADVWGQVGIYQGQSISHVPDMNL